MTGGEQEPEESGRKQDDNTLSWRDDDRERRQRALAELARQQHREQQSSGSEAPPSGIHANALGLPPPPVATLAPSHQHSSSRRPRWLAVIAAVLLIAVVGVLAVLHLRLGSTTSVIPSGPLTIDLGRTCPQDMAWSPDGKTIAIYNDCGTNGTFVAQSSVLLLDASTGRVTQRFDPDTLVDQALTATAPGATPTPNAGATSPPTNAFSHVLWSPTGGQLALPFDNGQIGGVLLFDPANAHARVISQPLADTQDGNGIWDLTTGALVPVPPNAPRNLPTDTGVFFPADLGGAALAYQWGPNGTLRPITPLNAVTPPALAAPLIVGNPVGGATFGIWQPGLAGVYAQASQGAPIYLPGVANFGTGFAAWSPDGRYLLANTNISVNLVDAIYGHLSGTAARALGGAALAPMHDRALSALLDAMHVTTDQPDPPGYSVAWTLDGKRLAVASEDTSAPAAPKVSVVVYDCASGRLLVRLSAPAALASTFFSAVWSPDGKHLLLSVATPDGAHLTVWGPGALPR